MKTTIVHKQN